MAVNSNAIKKIIRGLAVGIGAAFGILIILAKKKKPDSIYENNPIQKNPFEGKKVVFVEDENDQENADGVKGHLEAAGDSLYTPKVYDKYVKRVFDLLLSFGGLLLLSPVFAAIAIAIKIDDPGPVLFTQKRLGQNKKYFKLHKFRSMKMSTPHDVPTHMLDNPEQYITRVGRFIRLHSLDELPQIWDIFVGNMSVIGPRPALWNQDVLTAERDKYGVNNVKPGLTGWAQINGRDELGIPDKARLDGEYVRKMGVIMDVKCFIGSVHVFGDDKCVVEGCAGINIGEKREAALNVSDVHGDISKRQNVDVPKKRILITGAGSYIGGSVKNWLMKEPMRYVVTSIDMRTDAWREMDFSLYDIVYHVAGIAHADVGDVTEEQKKMYYAVNTDLAVAAAKKAKEAGVKQFIFMSSMIVYSGCEDKMITSATLPKPLNFYGDSKWQAEQKIRELEDEDFKVAVLRPPMIYGRGSKGNYSELARLASMLPVFPAVKNKRSMLHIDNLCQFVKLMIDNEESGVFFPQNGEYTNTSDMVRMIAEAKRHRILMVSGMSFPVKLIGRLPGKIGGLAGKAFGDSAYDMSMSEYKDNYRVRTLAESIRLTEGE